jgi:hypothetical protein
VHVKYRLLQEPNLFRIKILNPEARNMFCKPKQLKIQAYGLEDDVLQTSSAMFTKLTRVRVMTMGHQSIDIERAALKLSEGVTVLQRFSIDILTMTCQLLAETRHVQSNSFTQC